MKGERKVAGCAVIPAAGLRSRGRTRDDAMFSISSPRAEAADDYGATQADIRQRVLTQRLRVVIAADAAMVQAPVAQITSKHNITLLHV